MKDFLKGKFATGLVVIATVILAGVAIFTALQLYNLRNQPVAPNAPAKPKASTTPEACSLLTFTIAGNSPTITPTLPPGATATLTPIPSVTLTPTTRPTSGEVSNTPTPTSVSNLTPTPITVIPPSIAAPPTCDSLKPSAPTLTSVKKSGTQAVLTWTKSELATHYVISYGLTPENLQYGVPNTGNVTTYTINSLNSSSTYYFTVYAVNNCMPSDGSTIVGSVAGSGTSTSISTPTTSQATLPDAGSGTITLITFGAGIALITFALLLAI